MMENAESLAFYCSQCEALSNRLKDQEGAADRLYSNQTPKPFTAMAEKEFDDEILEDQYGE
jgi:hypothetical protein